MGISEPRTDWENATLDAAANYAEGVQQAIQDKRFSKGVEKAGTEKWKRKSLDVGVGRFGPGVQAAEQDYKNGFQPFADVIDNTVLPPRFPKGDPRNIERVKVIAEALRAKKLAG